VRLTERRFPTTRADTLCVQAAQNGPPDAQP
jgi:hypothetical protein